MIGKRERRRRRALEEVGLPLKSAAEIDGIAAAGALAAHVLAQLRPLVLPGVSTGELDEAAEQLIRDQGGLPSFLGYHGFAGSICVAPNSVVAHGIPGGYRLEDGDLIGIDVGVTLDGLIADTSFTFLVGEQTADALRLIEGCRAALDAAVAQCLPGNRTGDIGNAVELAAARYTLSVCDELTGHGVGYALHEDPVVANRGRAGRGALLEPGLVIAVEPHLNLGGPTILCLDDEWTLMTADGRRSCQYEHTVAITDGEPLVLTTGTVWQ